MTDHTDDETETGARVDDESAVGDESAAAGWDADLSPAAERDVHRGRLYEALATALDRPRATAADAERDPDPTVLGEVIAEAAAEIADGDADEGDAERADSRRELLDAAAAVTDRLPDDPTELERTFARTFGVETDGAVDRYEVAYAPGGVTVNTDRMADAAGFYRAFGLENAGGARDRADAVSVQLEFCSHLAAQRAYLRETGDETGAERVTEATAAFLEDHVGRWVPRFAADVREAADGGPFPALADALGAFVDLETERFGVEPEVFEEQPDGPVESLTGVDTDADGRLDLRCGTGGNGSSASEPNDHPAATGCGAAGRENFTGSPGQRAAPPGETPKPPSETPDADAGGAADAAEDETRTSEGLPSEPPSN
ncbi:TorA maturation chaperone TorD [Halorubrum trapanicum]|uniref:TorA maturation chaperone TorD n=1 Tax=Halorubrum trapanicum TaxID=29284 RepID=A0A8J7RV46_9EURY|nr:molecular chaperone TorD family protein [Halorubrum trapanicum]MBP1901570.1 TorA maturation chaperone TorD [Halorubrum trapanicum]